MNLVHSYTSPRSMFLGRFQPLHAGHEALIRTELDKGIKVWVAVRCMEIDDNNPYSFAQIWDDFRGRFYEEMEDRKVIVTSVPNIVKVCHGRNVGWEVEHIRLDEETENISATKIRNAKTYETK